MRFLSLIFPFFSSNDIATVPSLAPIAGLLTLLQSHLAQLLAGGFRDENHIFFAASIWMRIRRESCVCLIPVEVLSMEMVVLTSSSSIMKMSEYSKLLFANYA